MKHFLQLKVRWLAKLKVFFYGLKIDLKLKRLVSGYTQFNFKKIN